MQDIQEMQGELIKALEVRMTRLEEIHTPEHIELVMQLIQEKKLRNEIREEILKKLSTSGIIAALGIVFSILWFAAKAYFVHKGDG